MKWVGSGGMEISKGPWIDADCPPVKSGWYERLWDVETLIGRHGRIELAWYEMTGYRPRNVKLPGGIWYSEAIGSDVLRASTLQSLPWRGLEFRNATPDQICDVYVEPKRPESMSERDVFLKWLAVNL